MIPHRRILFLICKDDMDIHISCRHHEGGLALYLFCLQMAKVLETCPSRGGQYTQGDHATAHLHIGVLDIVAHTGGHVHGDRLCLRHVNKLQICVRNIHIIGDRALIHRCSSGIGEMERCLIKIHIRISHQHHVHRNIGRRHLVGIDSVTRIGVGVLRGGRNGKSLRRHYHLAHLIAVFGHHGSSQSVLRHHRESMVNGIKGFVALHLDGSQIKGIFYCGIRLGMLQSSITGSPLGRAGIANWPFHRQSSGVVEQVRLVILVPHLHIDVHPATLHPEGSILLDQIAVFIVTIAVQVQRQDGGAKHSVGRLDIIACLRLGTHIDKFVWLDFNKGVVLTCLVCPLSLLRYKSLFSHRVGP